MFSSVVRASHRYLRPSGIWAIWVRIRPGVAKASWTTHSGQLPPTREKWNAVADWRLEMLPARSIRTKKNGTPRCPVRCNVDRR
ncbi:Uncharacterised protein [Mycobacteroides abscessus subsp. abscessus]|nr:Uncharacterised protein [Mycobacteroides abscessus subsp. abscessus]